MDNLMSSPPASQACFGIIFANFRLTRIRKTRAYGS